MFKLAEPQFLHKRRNIDAESSPQTCLPAVPSAYRVARRPPPGLDGTFLRRLLLVRTAKFNPSARGLQHGVKIVDAARIVFENGFTDSADKDGLPIVLFRVHRELGRPGWRFEVPRILFCTIQRIHKDSIPGDVRWGVNKTGKGHFQESELITETLTPGFTILSKEERFAFTQSLSDLAGPRPVVNETRPARGSRKGLSILPRTRMERQRYRVKAVHGPTWFIAH